MKTLTMTPDFRKALGLRLRKQRKQRRWVMKEVAARLDIPIGQINKYEFGARTPPADRLLALARVCNVSVVEWIHSRKQFI